MYYIALNRKERRVPKLKDMIENVVEDRKKEQIRKRERIKNMRIEDIGDTGKFLEDDQFESLKERILKIREK